MHFYAQRLFLVKLSFTLYINKISFTSTYGMIEHSLALPFFWIGMKLTFSSPVATAEFSEFAGILSAALYSRRV